MTVHRKYLNAEELGLEVIPNGGEHGAGEQYEELDPIAREKGHQMGECSPRSFQGLLVKVNMQINTPEQRLQLAQEVERRSVQVPVRFSILSSVFRIKCGET
jgi:hypothetical protein